MLHLPAPKVPVRAGLPKLRAAIWVSVKKFVARGAVGGAFLWTATRTSAAEELAMPAAVQAKLSGSVAAYDRTLLNRAGAKVVVAIVTNPSDSDSVRAGSQMQVAFREVESIRRLPHEELVLLWKDGPTLAEACVRSKVSIVFLSTGLNKDIGHIVKVLEPLKVLTVAGSLPYVKQGVVLGFDLVSGRPKVVINLLMARRQGLDFQSDLLRLARVIE